MKFFLIAILSLFVLSACARNDAVAMDLYTPDNSYKEESSGITVVITQDMIDRVKKSRAH